MCGEIGVVRGSCFLRCNDIVVVVEESTLPPWSGKKRRIDARHDSRDASLSDSGRDGSARSVRDSAGPEARLPA